MKRLILLFFTAALLIGSDLNLQAQTSPTITWDKTLGGGGDEKLSSMQRTTDGGYILGGRSNSVISGDKSQNYIGDFDFWVVKLDANGNKSWDKTFGGSGYDIVTSLQQTLDGGYIVGGYSNSGISGDKTQASRGDMDYWVIKLDASGNKLWDKTFGGSYIDYLYIVQQTADGGYILGGSSASVLSGDKSQGNWGAYYHKDYWVVKLDANGNKTWDKTYGGIEQDDLRALKQTPDGGYILGGSSDCGISGDKSQLNKGAGDYWIVKLDAAGNKMWDKSLGGSNGDALFDLQLTSEGGYILGGSSTSYNGDKSQTPIGGIDYWILKLDTNGNKIWDKTFGGNDADWLTCMQKTSDGGYILGGYSKSGISGDKSQASNYWGDYWMVKVDAAGNKMWEKTVGGNNWEELYSIQQTSDGGYALAGFSDSGINGDKSQLSKGWTDYWIVKLGPNCADLTANFTASCNSGAAKVEVNIGGIQPATTGVPSWTLTYTVNGISQTASGSTPVFNIAQNAAPGTVYSLVSINSGTCTTNLTNSFSVQAIPMAPASTSGNRCGPGSVTLSATGVQAGGKYVWFDASIGGTALYSSQTGTFITPNLSTTTTYYVATTNNAGCEGPRTAVTATINPLPSISLATVQPICETAAPIQLVGFSPAGGIWSGPGINASGLFTPSNSLVGNQTLTYTVSQNGCSASATQVIMVTPQPVVNAGPAQTICETAPAMQLSGFSPSGGTWSGPGVNTSGLFTPNSSLIGNQTLTYTFNQNGCSVSANRIINVSAKPVVNAGATETICVNAAPVQLTGFSPAGGTWSGFGVSASGVFTPASSLAGNNTLTYTISQNGCTASATKQVTVPAAIPQPAINFLSPDTLISSVTGTSYSWKLNNAALPNTTRKFKATASGTYAVQVKDASNCSSAFSPDYIFVVTGLKEIENAEVKLYPNPTNGIVNLEFANPINAQVKVYNALGQCILTKTITKQDKKTTLDLAKAAKGIYTIQVTAEKQNLIKKIVLE